MPDPARWLSAAVAGVTVLLAAACAAPQADGPSTGGTAAPSAAPESPPERIAAGAYAGPVDIGG
jgi:hypothetical protein